MSRDQVHSPLQMQKHVWTITGPAGCGKTTVAKRLAEYLNIPYIEGDEILINRLFVRTKGILPLTREQYHPPANIEKMASGHPLTDADRWDWLVALRKEAVKLLALPEQGLDKAQSVMAAPSKAPTPQTSTSLQEAQQPQNRGVILTCSALKRKYRDVIRIASYENPDVFVHFVYLRSNEAETLERVRARQGHYMGEEMVTSQFASLEEPTSSEKDCVVVDVAGSTLEQVVKEALVKVKEIGGW